MAHGGSSKYYEPSNKEVFDGDTAEAKDLNSINNAVDAAFEEVADDLDHLESTLGLGETNAKKWATDPVGTNPDPLLPNEYSSKANKEEAKGWASASGTVIDSAGTDTGEQSAKTLASEAKVDAANAKIDAADALVSKDSATASEASASSSSSIALTQAAISTSGAVESYAWANTPVDTPVPQSATPPEYSAYHWAHKAMAGSTGVASIVGTVPILVDSTDAANPKVSIDPAYAEQVVRKGAPSGYAPLDANGKVPTANLPPSTSTPHHVFTSQALMLAGGAPILAGDLCLVHGDPDSNKDGEYIALQDAPTALSHYDHLGSTVITHRHDGDDVDVTVRGNTDTLTATLTSVYGSLDSKLEKDGSVKADSVPFTGLTTTQINLLDPNSLYVNHLGKLMWKDHSGGKHEVINIQDLSNYQLLSGKGHANGYAPLDNQSKVPLINIPALAQYQLKVEKGAASGYVPLDANTKIAAIYLPPSESTPHHIFSTQADMLAGGASVNIGDLCLVHADTDGNKNGEYVALQDNPTLITHYDHLGSSVPVHRHDGDDVDVTINGTTETLTVGLTHMGDQLMLKLDNNGGLAANILPFKPLTTAEIAALGGNFNILYLDEHDVLWFVDKAGIHHKVTPDLTTLLHADASVVADAIPFVGLNTGQVATLKTDSLYVNDSELLMFKDNTGLSHEVIGGGGGLAWETSDSGLVTAVDGAGYLLDCSAAARILVLPHGIVGEQIGVGDWKGDAGTNNITVKKDPADKIMGLAEDLILDIDNSCIVLTYANSTEGWKIIQTTPSGNVLPNILHGTGVPSDSLGKDGDIYMMIA